jgi:vancomycin aglycone glucosyltransferase
MRIVLCGDGTRGDVQPLIELAFRIRSAGHEAVVSGPPDFEGLARHWNVPYAAAGASAQAFFSEHAAIMKRNPAAMIGEAFDYLSEKVVEKLAIQLEIATGADLVLAGGAELSASSAAERLGVPYRYVVYCPVLLPSREHAPAFLNIDCQRRWLNRLLWPLAMKPISLAASRLLNPARRTIGLAPIRKVYRHMIGERPLLAADRVLSRAPADSRLRVDQIPALHPLDGEALPPKLEAFLAAGPAPVYVGFGSMPDSEPIATTRLVLAAVERLGVRTVLSAGWARLGGVPLPDGVIEIGPVTHPLLFPRCAAIIHHGGAGTTTNALRAGVPQVIVPHLADQFFWRRRVVELGVGATAPRKTRIDADSLSAALGAVLDNEVLAARAGDLGEQALASAREIDPVEHLWTYRSDSRDPETASPS